MGRAAASHVGRLARHALERGPAFRLAVSGGTSPIGMFRHLANPALFPSALWEKTHLFFADERLVPPDHVDSNFRGVDRHLLQRVALPPRNIHRMHGELPPDEAAQAYTAELARMFGPNITPTFDLIILGMGADGHTASIFPGMPSEPSAPVQLVPAPTTAPRVPRLTLTPTVLNVAARVLFLVVGADKHPALHAIRHGGARFPAANVDVRDQSWYICPPLPTRELNTRSV